MALIFVQSVKNRQNLTNSGGFDQPDDLDREWAEFAACLDGQLAAIPGSADDVDSELFELVNGGERVSAQENELHVRISDMLKRYGVDTIAYFPEGSQKEGLEKREVSRRGYIQAVEDGDLSRVDLQSIEPLFEAYSDEPETLERLVRENLEMQSSLWVTRRTSAEIFAITMASMELGERLFSDNSGNSEGEIDLSRKINDIARHLLDLDEDTRSSWFGFLNEAFGGEDVSSEQVEQAMNNLAAVKKAKSTSNKGMIVIEQIIEETGGKLDAVDRVLIASYVQDIWIKKINGDNGEMMRRIADLSNRTGLSSDQIERIVDQFDNVIRNTDNDEKESSTDE